MSEFHFALIDRGPPTRIRSYFWLILLTEQRIDTVLVGLQWATDSTSKLETMHGSKSASQDFFAQLKIVLVLNRSSIEVAHDTTALVGESALG